jgi:hypothetical protein
LGDGVAEVAVEVLRAAVDGADFEADGADVATLETLFDADEHAFGDAAAAMFGGDAERGDVAGVERFDQPTMKPTMRPSGVTARKATDSARSADTRRCRGYRLRRPRSSVGRVASTRRVRDGERANVVTLHGEGESFFPRVGGSGHGAAPLVAV